MHACMHVWSMKNKKIGGHFSSKNKLLHIPTTFVRKTEKILIEYVHVYYVTE